MGDETRTVVTEVVEKRTDSWIHIESRAQRQRFRESI